MTHSALGELPATPAHAPTEKDLAAGAHQDDADVCAETVRVDDVVHGLMGVCHNLRLW